MATLTIIICILCILMHTSPHASLVWNCTNKLLQPKIGTLGTYNYYLHKLPVSIQFEVKALKNSVKFSLKILAFQSFL